MRLIRFGPKGMERPGLMRAGRIVDVKRHFPRMPDIGAQFFSDGWPARVAALDDPGEAMEVRLGPPLPR